MAEFSLIKIDGELAKPATVLVEKISSALGIIYEPTQIKRKARANAEADKIKAVSNLEIDELQRRALTRFVSQEARKQKNIEQITAATIESLPDDAKVADLEEDWVAYFFKQCEHISDKEMQTVWAKLLSGEATKPGSYSKRTVDLISSIDKNDAELFTKLCDFVCDIGGATLLVYDVENEIYNKNQINFSTLKHLDTLGLISFESISGYIKKKFTKKAILYYYGRLTEIEFQKEEDNQLNTGNVLLTNAGRELLNICGSKPSEEFYEYFCSQLNIQGLILSSLVVPGRSF